jgi:tetratricopeptide (TPR) repeat protein
MQIAKNLLIAAFLSLFVFSSCTKNSEENMLLEAKNKMDEAKRLDSENKVDEAKPHYIEAIKIYDEILKEYPNSEKAPDIYSNIAKIYSDNLRDYTNAIKYYNELITKFPQTREAKYGMFMIAFIYDEMLKNKELAKESYQKFLDKYPKDEDPNEKMSESARIMLQMLEENRSIEDIIKQSQQKSAGEQNDTTMAPDSDANTTPKTTPKKSQ